MATEQKTQHPVAAVVASALAAALGSAVLVAGSALAWAALVGVVVLFAKVTVDLALWFWGLW